MTDKIADIGCVTRLNTSPAQILRRAESGDLESVIIIGENKDGREFFASSYPDGPSALWCLERAKHKLLASVDE